MMADSEVLPGWLSGIVNENFFDACIIHEERKRNEKNVFCLDCCEGICAHCIADHASHRLLKIRRYMYCSVIRGGDAQKLMDCANVQTYTSNNAKVIFLQQRPLPRSNKASGNLCLTCDRNLHDSSCCYCSISCKVQHLLSTGCDISEHLRKCEILELSEPGSHDDQMTPDSVLEQDGSMPTESGSASGLSVECTTEVVRKKRTGSLRVRRAGKRPDNEPVVDTSEVEGSRSRRRRRKGIPRRAPMV